MSIFKDLGFKNINGELTSPDSNTLEGYTLDELKQMAPLYSNSNEGNFLYDDADGVYELKNFNGTTTVSQEEDQAPWSAYSILVKNIAEEDIEITINGKVQELQKELSVSDVNISKISCDGATTLVLLSNGQVYGTGYNYYGQLGSIPKSTYIETWKNLGFTDANDIFVYSNSSYVVLKNGDIYVAGKNYYGQLGIGSFSDSYEWKLSLQTTGVKKIEAINNRIGILTNDNILYMCGYNPYGCIGVGNASNVSSWRNVGSSVTDFALGMYHSVKVQSDKIYSVGFNNYGQIANANLGDYTYSWLSTYNTLNIADKLFCSNYATYALYGGTLYTVGNTSQDYFDTMMNNVRDVTIKSDSIYIITDTNELWVIGSNNYGKLGVGNNAHVSVITKVSDNVKKVFPTGLNTYVETLNGDILSSGHNGHNQQLQENTDSLYYFTVLKKNVEYFTTDLSGFKNFVVKDGILTAFGENSHYTFGLDILEIESGVEYKLLVPEYIGVDNEYKVVDIAETRELTISTNKNIDNLIIKLWV